MAGTIRCDIRLEQKWSKVEPKWNKSGTKVEQKWNKSGAKWNKVGQCLQNKSSMTDRSKDNQRGL